MDRRRRGSAFLPVGIFARLGISLALQVGDVKSPAPTPISSTAEGDGRDRPKLEGGVKTMLPITGYSDRFSVRPSETIAFKIDCREAEEFSARLVRVRCGDPNPAGPGIRETDLSHVFSGRYPGRRQEVRLGSYVHVGDAEALQSLASFTLDALVWPTTPDRPGQGILVRLAEDGSAGFALVLDGTRGVSARLGTAAGPISVATGAPLRRRTWYRVFASFDAATGTLTVG